MKTDTKDSTTVICNWTRLLGAMLVLALMVPAVAFSQGGMVNLQTAGNFAILAGAAISGGGNVTGNLGTTSGSIAGVTASGYTIYPVNDPVVQTAQTHLAAAYLDASTRTGATALGADVDLTSAGTLVPGVYSITGNATITTFVTLNGAGVYIFQIGGSLTTTTGYTSVSLGGASWTTIFWQVGSFAALAASSTFEGTVMANNYVTAGASSVVHGRLLAKTNYVTSNASTVLPVEMVSFTATASRMNANLHWSTATEVNNYGFEVERRQSADWSKVGFVAGAGTSNSPRDYSYTDNNLSSGRYTYRLKQVDNNGAFSYHGSVEVVITGTATTSFALSQNYPNPFNPSTQIQYSLQNAAQVSLKIYNVLGNEVATLVNGPQEAGNYTVPFNTAGTPGLSSGVYFCRLEAGSFVATNRLILIK